MATAQNTAQNFPNVTPQAVVTARRKVTHLTIWEQAARTNLLGTVDVTDTAVLALGQAVTISAGIIRFTVPTPTNGTARAARNAVVGMHGGGTGVYVDAHYGAPGNGGTANRLAELGQARITTWTYS